MINQALKAKILARSTGRAVSFVDLMERFTSYLLVGREVTAEDDYVRWWLETFDMIRPRIDETKALEILEHRHKFYGARSLLLTGEFGILVRCIDKLCRIDNILKTEQDDAQDPMNDAWLDLFNYSLLAVLLLEGGLT